MSPLGRQLRSTAIRYRPSGRAIGLQLERPGGPSQLAVTLWSNRPAETKRTTITDPRSARRQRLEAVLLLSREPLALRRLAKLANLADATEARTLLKQLSERYDARGSAFTVEAVAGGYQLLTRSKLAPWLEKFAPPADDLRLSPPALETLVVVAYRQPLLRAEIEAIRGVGCGELLRQLMERELLRIVGRSQQLGRPLMYGTTKRFLQWFGLKDLEGLPRYAELRGETIPLVGEEQVPEKTAAAA
jgi:segregation and condensation protein B